jgi:hypothetical protein
MMKTIKQHNKDILNGIESPVSEELLPLLDKLQNPPTAQVNGDRISLQYGFAGRGPRLDLFPEYCNEFRLTTYFNKGTGVVSLEDVFPREELQVVIKVLSIIYI